MTLATWLANREDNIYVIGVSHVSVFKQKQQRQQNKHLLRCFKYTLIFLMCKIFTQLFCCELCFIERKARRKERRGERKTPGRMRETGQGRGDLYNIVTRHEPTHPTSSIRRRARPLRSLKKPICDKAYFLRILPRSRARRGFPRNEPCEALRRKWPS